MRPPSERVPWGRRLPSRIRFIGPLPPRVLSLRDAERLARGAGSLADVHVLWRDRGAVGPNHGPRGPYRWKDRGR